MRIASQIAAAAVVAVSLALPASAQEESVLQERNVYIFMNGKMVHMRVSDAAHEMIMREFKAIAPGTMVYYSNGRFYMAEDKRMANGRMMHADIFGRDLGSGTQQ